MVLTAFAQVFFSFSFHFFKMLQISQIDFLPRMAYTNTVIT